MVGSPAIDTPPTAAEKSKWLQFPLLSTLATRASVAGPARTAEREPERSLVCRSGQDRLGAGDRGRARPRQEPFSMRPVL